MLILSYMANAKCKVKNKKDGIDGYAVLKGEQEMHSILACTCIYKTLTYMCGVVIIYNNRRLYKIASWDYT
jgi:hypothetical protein